MGGTSPQRLKPGSIQNFYVRPKGRTLQKSWIKFSVSRRPLLLPKGQRLLAGAFRCCIYDEGVYFCYFLDPDQGQTGPVSWEVAPLPPPRPVLTLTLTFACPYWRYRPSKEAGPATARSTKSPENSRFRINAPASSAAKTAPSRCGTMNRASTIGSAGRARSIHSSRLGMPSPV